MSLNLYPDMILEGDLSPDAFGDEVDDICNEIHAACKGFGTDEDRLLKAMGSQSPETRCKVHLRYKEMFGKDLASVMRSEAGKRSFGQTLQFLAVDPVMAECEMIDKACKGAGTDELLLFTIICGRTNKEMALLKKKYFALKDKDLGRTLDAELGGDFESLIVNCLQAAQQDYDPDYHNEEQMEKDCNELRKLGLGRLGTNESGLFRMICAAPPEYLQKLNDFYSEKYGKTLVKAVAGELGGKPRDAVLFAMGMKLKPYEEIANLIDRSCKGFGTNEVLLITTLIRYQGMMKEVTLAHVEMGKGSIEDRIKSETGGDFEKVLLEILKAGQA